ncbi:MAG: hypothetical protein IT361_14085 [Gemmatimonadaceae bacterium]|nr:hypothetical protein [Gemmatimonadaceae bacterium]
MSLQRRTLLETSTTLAPGEVLAAAREFFTRRNSLYAAFVEQASDRHLSLRGQGGEEIVIAAVQDGAHTRVTGSTYMFDAQVSRFFSVLPVVATPVGAA